MDVLRTCIHSKKDFKADPGYIDKNSNVFIRRLDLSNQSPDPNTEYFDYYLKDKNKDTLQIGEQIYLYRKPEDTNRYSKEFKLSYKIEIEDAVKNVYVKQTFQDDGTIRYQPKNSSYCGLIECRLLE